MKIFSWILIAVGVLGVALSLGMDTSVGTGGRRVFNLGLLSMQSNLLMVFSFVSVVGVLLVLSQRRSGTSGDSEKVGASSSKEATRVCPFCAEEIKKAAVLCRYCGKTVPPIPEVDAESESGAQVRRSGFRKEVDFPVEDRLQGFVLWINERTANVPRGFDRFIPVFGVFLLAVFFYYFGSAFYRIYIWEGADQFLRDSNIPLDYKGKHLVASFADFLPFLVASLYLLFWGRVTYPKAISDDLRFVFGQVVVLGVRVDLLVAGLWFSLVSFVLGVVFQDRVNWGWMEVLFFVVFLIGVLSYWLVERGLGAFFMGYAVCGLLVDYYLNSSANVVQSMNHILSASFGYEDFFVGHVFGVLCFFTVFLLFPRLGGISVFRNTLEGFVMNFEFFVFDRRIFVALGASVFLYSIFYSVVGLFRLSL